MVLDGAARLRILASQVGTHIEAEQCALQARGVIRAMLGDESGCLTDLEEIDYSDYSYKVAAQIRGVILAAIDEIELRGAFPGEKTQAVPIRARRPSETAVNHRVFVVHGHGFGKDAVARALDPSSAVHKLPLLVASLGRRLSAA